MTIGAALRAARERKQMSTSAVAGATRSKVQIIEAIERDDFSVFAAPIYGKGFIRLYAQVVDLDPLPLLEAFSRQTVVHKPPSLVSAFAPPAAEPEPETADEAEEPSPAARRRPAQEFDLFNDTAPRAPAATPSPEAPRVDAPSRSAVAAELLREVAIRWTQALRESLRLGRTSAAEITAKKDPWKAVPVVIGIVIVLIFVASGLSKCARHTETAAGRTPGAGGGALRAAAEVPEPYFE